MTGQKTLSSRTWAELLLLSAIWGGSFLAFAVALGELPVITVVFHRVFWGALALWIIVLTTGIPVPKGPKIWMACLVMGLLNNVIPFALIAWAQTSIESGLASILNGTTAFFGLLLAALAFSDEKLTRPKAYGTLLAFFGVVVVIGIDALRAFDIRATAQLAMLGASFSYGLAAVWARKTLSDIPPQSAALGMLTGASLIVVPMTLVLDGVPHFSLEFSTFAAILYLSLFATTFAYLLYYRVLAQAGSANLMLCTLLIVPVAVTLGALVLDEALALSVYAGFACIALGMFIIDGRIFRTRAGRDRA